MVVSWLEYLLFTVIEGERSSVRVPWGSKFFKVFSVSSESRRNSEWDGFFRFGLRPCVASVEPFVFHFLSSRCGVFAMILKLELSSPILSCLLKKALVAMEVKARCGNVRVAGSIPDRN